MGPSHIFEVFHPAVEVAVLHKVLSYLHSVAVWDLLTRVAHRLSEQEVRPGKLDLNKLLEKSKCMHLLLSRYNTHVFTQERGSWAFAFVGNGSIVGSCDLVTTCDHVGDDINHGSGSTQSHQKTRGRSGQCSHWTRCRGTSRRNHLAIALISWMTPLGTPWRMGMVLLGIS